MRVDYSHSYWRLRRRWVGRRGFLHDRTCLEWVKHKSLGKLSSLFVLHHFTERWIFERIGISPIRMAKCLFRASRTPLPSNFQIPNFLQGFLDSLNISWVLPSMFSLLISREVFIKVKVEFWEFTIRVAKRIELVYFSFFWVYFVDQTSQIFRRHRFGLTSFFKS